MRRLVYYPVLTAWTLVLSSAPVSVLTNRYDNFGSGANVHETILNASNVNPATFGKLYTYPVDGSVYAQPLYMPSVEVPGRGAHNILYVATMNDKVYAFDADVDGPPVWTRDLTNRAAGVTAVPVADITGADDLNIVGNAGIESTPVIDPATRTLYLLARTKESGRYVQRLHALDITTGADRRKPVVIEAHVKSSAKDAVNGVLRFNAKTGNQRTALALTNGMILIAWASHEDIEPYHGWVMAYDAATLKQAAVFCTTPTGTEGGIWQSGRGPAIDADGNIYYEVGNGDWDGVRNFGESLIKLRVSKKGFAVADYFTPSDYEALNKEDADLGSSGPMLIPNTDIVICGDKKGVLRLLNIRNLGHKTQNDWSVRQAVPVNGGRVLAGVAYWDSPTGPLVYVWGEADFLKAFRFRDGVLGPAVHAKGTYGSHGSPGGALTVSANGNQTGTGIVWGMLTVNKSADHGNAAGILCAYNAETLQELWTSERNAERDRLGTLVKFVPPVVAAGRVYALTYDNAVMVYGPIPR